MRDWLCMGSPEGVKSLSADRWSDVVTAVVWAGFSAVRVGARSLDMCRWSAAARGSQPLTASASEPPGTAVEIPRAKLDGHLRWSELETLGRPYGPEDFEAVRAAKL